jgi:hypothetical protein
MPIISITITYVVQAERKTARELAKDQKLVFGSINSEEEIEANIKLAEAMLEENNAPEEEEKEEPVLLFDDYGGYSEEPEETEEPEYSEYYEEAEFLDEKMRRRAEKEALRKEKRQILKDIKAEQKRLKELSKKWSKVNVALQNPQVVTQAEEVAKDMAMDMGMGASAADFAEEASLSVILRKFIDILFGRENESKVAIRLYPITDKVTLPYLRVSFYISVFQYL